jgi:hypothetical protein
MWSADRSCLLQNRSVLFTLKQDAKNHLRTAKAIKVRSKTKTKTKTNVGCVKRSNASTHHPKNHPKNQKTKKTQTAKSTTMKRDRAFAFIRTLASSYFGGPSLANYRRRNVVSPLSSGWMSVGPTCHRHQECY